MALPDVAPQEVRDFDPGALISGPAPGAELERMHATARMQPGVSGGDLVDAEGALVGIAIGDDDGRFEAIPLRDICVLHAGRDSQTAGTLTNRLGKAFADCAAAIDDVSTADKAAFEALTDHCAVAMNHGQLLEAGRHLAQAGAFGAAAELHEQAVRQVSNPINARLSLLLSLQLDSRFEDMIEHARFC